MLLIDARVSLKIDLQDDANTPAKDMVDTGGKFRGSEALMVKLAQKLAPHPSLNISEMGPTWQAESNYRRRRTTYS